MITDQGIRLNVYLLFYLLGAFGKDGGIHQGCDSEIFLTDVLVTMGPDCRKYCIKLAGFEGHCS